jgi:hypothetical protein
MPRIVSEGDYRGMPSQTRTDDSGERAHPFAAYFRTWLATYARHHCKPGTVAGYEAAGRLYLIPTFGDRDLRTITRADVKRLVYETLLPGRARATVRANLAPLRELFNHAIEDGVVASNPAAHVLKRMRGEKRAHKGRFGERYVPTDHVSTTRTLTRAFATSRSMSVRSLVTMSAERVTATVTTAASAMSAVPDLPSSEPVRCAPSSSSATTSHPRRARRSVTCLGDRLTCATTGAGTHGTMPSSSRTRCSAQNRRSLRSAAISGPAS